MTGGQAYALTPDGMTLVIKSREPAGIRTVTLHREPGAGPFTEADVATALSQVIGGKNMQPGQHNTSRRTVTRFGTVWTHVMTGPPTWWVPRIKHEKDGTVMAGWLRLAVAVKIGRPDHRPEGTRT